MNRQSPVSLDFIIGCRITASHYTSTDNLICLALLRAAAGCVPRTWRCLKITAGPLILPMFWWSKLVSQKNWHSFSVWPGLEKSRFTRWPWGNLHFSTWPILECCFQDETGVRERRRITMYTTTLVLERRVRWNVNNKVRGPLDFQSYWSGVEDLYMFGAHTGSLLFKFI